jgi:hypothetical protein
MAESRQNYEMLKELLKDEDFRKLTGKVLEIQSNLASRTPQSGKQSGSVT